MGGAGGGGEGWGDGGEATDDGEGNHRYDGGVAETVDGDAGGGGGGECEGGEKFLAENGKKEGVVTTASGLQYKVNKSGAGKSPKATDTVAVNYKGTLISGKELDASRGEPATFPVNGVIPVGPRLCS